MNLTQDRNVIQSRVRAHRGDRKNKSAGEGGINGMQISPRFFRSWQLKRCFDGWGGRDTVSPTSLSNSPPNKQPPFAPSCGTFCWLAAGDLITFMKMNILCHEETLGRTRMFVHLVKQYPHQQPIQKNLSLLKLNHYVTQVRFRKSVLISKYAD